MAATLGPWERLLLQEPVAAEEILADDHRDADENGVGDTQQTIAGQTVAAEDETTDDGLEASATSMRVLGMLRVIYIAWLG